VWVDIFGLLFFLMPLCALMVYLSWPLFMKMYLSGEMSSNSGGLIRWPAMLLLPVGFSLMFIQGLAETLKRVLFLMGVIKLDTHYEKPLQ
jgi:TRAP-type mannitol/chloroaromatic compound transport system permease small subunit